jgi:hypothetical protein
MVARCISALVLMCLTILASGCDKHAQDRIEIAALTNRMGEAIDARNGDAYAELLCADSIDYHDRTLKLILSGKKADIENLPFHQRYEILLVRMIGKKKDLKALDAKGYAAWAVTNGIFEYMPGPQGQLVPGDLIFRKDEAYLNLVDESGRKVRRGKYVARSGSDRTSTSYTYRFVLEKSLWKFDETAFAEAFDKEVSVEVKRAGVDENKVLLAFLSESLGRDVPQSVWNSMP